ncbi:class I SAM-dependent methyltransferase [Microlunatus parietis]|uniref:SAM-dependent methyltransferase n=1 Tax=Microlunatus parietis TaxID=682979 RepID=A0A7Y9I421_9ACTN|nr:class I SAM-dependent methyltransferase [Microlunatus parietis]NYE69881.1 SAM-dependent methyltransferase [Microlunatus parietis]
MALNEERLFAFLQRCVDDAAATIAAGTIVVGARLGLYRALAARPSASPEELAAATETAPRYVEEWLRGQAAGGYVDYDPETGRYSMTEEQAFALTNPEGPVYLPGTFQLALGALRAEPRITELFRTGGGMPWHEHDPEVFTGCEFSFRPGYAQNLVTEWMPQLTNAEAKLRAGAWVADVGCGHGASTVLMAQAYPESTFVGFDSHTGSIEVARKRAAEAGVADRVTFETGTAQDFPGGTYDLVTTFDCLHDLGDPLQAARRIRASLTTDGTWMIVEPVAGDSVADNLNPIGRLYYSFSTFLCVPNALAQEGGYALGAQAGERPLRQLAQDAGFNAFRKAAESPFNSVYEARP